MEEVDKLPERDKATITAALDSFSLKSRFQRLVHTGDSSVAARIGGSIMQAHTAKQEALEAIQRLPDNADTDTEEIMYRLYVLENIRRGQQDAADGKTQSAEEVLKDIQSW